jgi:hypothetical protein
VRYAAFRSRVKTQAFRLKRKADAAIPCNREGHRTMV